MGGGRHISNDDEDDEAIWKTNAALSDDGDI
jgi:hypothetical protein